MAGLIWAGIGQGISSAGNAFGTALMQEARDNTTLAREEMRDKRLMEKQAALEEIREQNRIAREERQAKDRQEQAGKAMTVADETARNREADTTAKREAEIAGAASKVRANNESAPQVVNTKTKKPITQSPSASEEEIRQLIKNNPQALDLYAQAGLINKEMMGGKQGDPRLQRAQDEYDAAVGIGAHSSVVEAFDKKRARVLEEIRAENQVKREDNRHKETMAREDRLASQFRETLPILQQRADASTTSANRPRSSDSDPNKPATTADIQRQVTAAENQIATELGVAKKDVNAEIKAIRKRADAGNAQAKATLQRIQPMVDELNGANRRMLEFKRPSSGGATAPSAPSSTSRPPLSSFRQ